MLKEEQQFTGINNSQNTLISDVPDNSSDIALRSRVNSLPQLNARSVGILLAILAVSMVAGYLGLSNNFVNQGFALNVAKNRVAELTKINRELELAAMNLESYENINQKIAQLDMVKVQNVEYVEVRPDGVAMR